MKFYKLPLLAMYLMVLCACMSEKYNRCTPEEEQCLAHDFLVQANKTSVDDNKERMRLFNKATFHFANIVVRNDANDTLRADALFTLRWIAAYITHDYDQALQYLNQYLELVGPEHESYPTCLAYKADDLWHFGAHDSAMHYARMALEAPHTTNDQIEYICHHILWNIYDTRNMPDSAQKHKDKHMKIRESRVFEPMTMEQLKSNLQSNIISPKTLTGEPENSHTTWFLAIGALGFIGCIVLALTIYRLTKDNTSNDGRQYIVKQASTQQSNSRRSEMLSDAFAEGCRALEESLTYQTICSTKVSEREWLAIDNEQIRMMESSIFESFKNVCRIMLDNAELNDHELLCSIYVYLGFSNTLIAHFCHTTSATIRKRRERIRKKLDAEFYEVIFNGR